MTSPARPVLKAALVFHDGASPALFTSALHKTAGGNEAQASIPTHPFSSSPHSFFKVYFWVIFLLEDPYPPGLGGSLLSLNFTIGMKCCILVRTLQIISCVRARTVPVLFTNV